MLNISIRRKCCHRLLHSPSTRNTLQQRGPPLAYLAVGVYHQQQTVAYNPQLCLSAYAMVFSPGCASRWNVLLLLLMGLTTGSTFLFPGDRVSLDRRARRLPSKCSKPPLPSTTCWRLWQPIGPSMVSMSSSPSEDEGENDDGDVSEPTGENDEFAGVSAGREIGANNKIPANANGKQAPEYEVDDGGESDYFMEGAENAGLELLARGDSLPLSYRSDNGTRETEFYLEPGEKENINPYYDVVRRLSPTELIGRFMRTASPRVQEAVRTTVLGIMGSLPRHAFETTAISTGGALANLMFQLQMTGYMFKNAEYRLSLQSSMHVTAYLEDNDAEDGTLEMDEDGRLKVARPKISGKIKLTYDAETERERALEVDADAYMTELRGQVQKLESKLLEIRQRKDAAVEKDLLMYIKSMPENQLQSLTARVSPEVLDAMRLLVQTVMGGMGNSEILAQTLTQQTGSSLAQLCMWQLVVGFNLREMEAREDLRRNFNK